jgi:hypothetical protein
VFPCVAAVRAPHANSPIYVPALTHARLGVRLLAWKGSEWWSMQDAPLLVVEDENRLYSRKDAARYLTTLGLETAPQTLARKFHEGTGPLCTHVGERAMYRKTHLDEYFTAQVSAPRRSSSEPKRMGSLS